MQSMKEKIEGLIEDASRKCEDTIENIRFATGKVIQILEEERDLKIQNYLSILENLEKTEIPESVSVGRDSPPRRKKPKQSREEPGAKIREVLKASGMPLQEHEILGVYQQLHGETPSGEELHNELDTLSSLGYVVRARGRVGGVLRTYYQDVTNPHPIKENIQRLVAASKVKE